MTTAGLGGVLVKVSGDRPLFVDSVGGCCWVAVDPAAVVGGGCCWVAVVPAAVVGGGCGWVAVDAAAAVVVGGCCLAVVVGGGDGCWIEVAAAVLSFDANETLPLTDEALELDAAAAELAASSYSSAHWVALKHPSVASQYLEANPFGHGFDCKHSDVTVEKEYPQK